MVGLTGTLLQVEQVLLNVEFSDELMQIEVVGKKYVPRLLCYHTITHAEPPVRSISWATSSARRTRTWNMICMTPMMTSLRKVRTAFALRRLVPMWRSKKPALALTMIVKMMMQSKLSYLVLRLFDSDLPRPSGKGADKSLKRSADAMDEDAPSTGGELSKKQKK